MKVIGLLFCCWLIALPLAAQQSNTRTPPISLKAQLDAATQLSQKDPGQAITLLKQIVSFALEQGDLSTLAGAYVLIASINERLGQYDLAITRRRQAEHVYRQLHQSTDQQWQSYHIARLYLLLRQPDQSLARLLPLQREKPGKTLALRIQEGIADARQLSNQLDEGLRVYDSLEQQYQIINDTRNLQRIQAKQAKNYARQGNAPRAQEYLQNSMRNTQIAPDPANLGELDQAKEEVVRQFPTLEIPTREEFLHTQSQLSDDKEAIIQEQLKIANAYADRGELDRALDYVNASKKIALEEGTTVAAPEVYLRSSELLAMKGRYSEALADITRYETSRSQADRAQQQKVDELLAVLRAQQHIDLIEKDYELGSAQRKYTQDRSSIQRVLIGLLSVLLLGALISIYLIQKNVRSRKKAHQQLLLKSLRSQMNPHFIFNVLNSVNNFIARNDERAANRYLSEFSTLMRRVLSDSQNDFVSLEEELDQVAHYLKLEHLRFRDKFTYQIEVSPGLDLSQYPIPPMLIQPFVENAVWHGMRYKEKPGHIRLEVMRLDSQLQIVISDNGIGRQRSAQLKTTNQRQYTSTAMTNIDQRIQLINQVYGTQYELSVSDLTPGADDPGTRVTLHIPEFSPKLPT